MLVLLILLSQAPIIAIYSYVYFRDDKGREPLILLCKTFVLGGLTCIPAAFIESWFGIDAALQTSSAVQFFIAAQIVALAEEGVKFAVLKWYAYPKAEFDEPYDGIMYAVSISLGFAALENFGYVLGNGLSAALLRMFTAVPMHAMTAVLMGFEAGKAKFEADDKRRRSHLWRALAIPAALHGLYDFFLFFNSSLMFLFAMTVLVYQLRVTRAAMAQFAAHIPGRQASLFTPAPPHAQAVIAPRQLRYATGLLWFTRMVWIFVLVVAAIGLLFSDTMTAQDRDAAIGFGALSLVVLPVMSFIIRRLREGSRLAWFLALGIFVLFLGTPLFVLGLIGMIGLLNSASRSYFWGTSTEEPVDVTPAAA
ncbi:MAG: PrsW family glutamic-type intramembrane protease [Bdellovibrionota bacterium]